MFSGASRTRILAALGVLAALSSGALLQGCGGATDDRPAAWSYIYPAIIEPSCATASCHSNFTRRAGVNFGLADEAYYQMICRHFVTTCPTATMPLPAVCNQPTATSDATCPARAAADSQIVHQMRAEGAPRMPPDFALPEVDIQLIERWIGLGAQND